GRPPLGVLAVSRGRGTAAAIRRVPERAPAGRRADAAGLQPDAPGRRGGGGGVGGVHGAARGSAGTQSARGRDPSSAADRRGRDRHGFGGGRGGGGGGLPRVHAAADGAGLRAG